MASNITFDTRDPIFARSVQEKTVTDPVAFKRGRDLFLLNKEGAGVKVGLFLLKKGEEAKKFWSIVA